MLGVATRLRDSDSRRYAVGLAISAGFVAGGLAIGHADHITDAQAWLAASIVVLGCFPAVKYLFDRRFDSVPLFPATGLFYVLTYGLTVFSEYFDFRGIDESSVTEALALTIAGLLALFVGYYGIALRFRMVGALRLESSYSGGLIRMVGLILIWARVAIELVPNIDSTLSQLVSPLGNLGVCFLVGQLIDGHQRTDAYILPIASLGALMLVSLASGLFFPALYLLLLSGLVYWQKRNKLPWRSIIFVIVMFLTLNPLKSEFRNITWDARVQEFSAFEKLEAFATLAIQETQNIWRESSLVEGENVRRVSHIRTFALIIANTPSQIPYWNGETLLPLLTKLIPRFIWPDKPEESLGNSFWHVYGLLDVDDFKTSYNIPWLPELYANFGGLGVILGSGLIGILFRFLVEKFRVADGNYYRFYFGLSLFFYLFYAESNISLMFGGLVWAFIVLFLFFRWLQSFDERRVAF